MVEPTGVPARIEARSPTTVHTTEKAAEKIITDLKLLKSRIAESAGKIINAEIRSEPTRFIASTMITAMVTAIKKLYAPHFYSRCFGKAFIKSNGKNLVIKHAENNYYGYRQCNT